MLRRQKAQGGRNAEGKPQGQGDTDNDGAGWRAERRETEGPGRRWREEGKAEERGHRVTGAAERDGPGWGRRWGRGGTEGAVGHTEAEQARGRARQVSKAEVGQSPEAETREGETEGTRKAAWKGTNQRSRRTLPGSEGGRRREAGGAAGVFRPLNRQLGVRGHPRPGPPHMLPETCSGTLSCTPRPSQAPAVPRTLSHELDLVRHGGAQLIAGKAAVGALEPLGEVAVVARDGEGAGMGRLVHGHTRFLLGFEVDAVPSPAEPVGRKGLRGRRPWNPGQGLAQAGGHVASSQGPRGWAVQGKDQGTRERSGASGRRSWAALGGKRTRS